MVQGLEAAGPSTNRPAREQQERRRHALVVVLTTVTGFADATGFVALGGAFSSVMTGNMVLLGLSAGHADAALAITAGAAIASYILGVLLGASIAGGARSSDPVWPREVSRALLAELVVFLAFLAVWEATLEERSPTIELALLAIAAGALGIQSSAVQRFGVPGLSSTYLTGTLTNLISAVAARHRWTDMRPQAEILLALIAGAAAGAVVLDRAPWLSPVFLVLPLAGVLAFSARLNR